MLERFYCPESPMAGLFTLTGDEARHLVRVRRVGIGEEVELFDGRGTVYRAQVTAIEKDRAVLAIQEVIETDHLLRVSLTLASAVPKGERFDWLVEKATELGVARLIPLETERSVVAPGPSKLDRLRRSIIESSKQCRRNRLMELANPMRWDSLVGQEQQGCRLLAHPGSPATPWSELRGGTGPVLVAVGPEGGFSDREVARGVEARWRTVGLGSTILRVETAAIAAASIVRAMIGLDLETRQEGEET